MRILFSRMLHFSGLLTFVCLSGFVLFLLSDPWLPQTDIKEAWFCVPQGFVGRPVDFVSNFFYLLLSVWLVLEYLRTGKHLWKTNFGFVLLALIYIVVGILFNPVIRAVLGFGGRLVAT